MYRLKWTYGHWTIYKDGRFWGTADTEGEAIRDIEEADEDE